MAVTLHSLPYLTFDVKQRDGPAMEEDAVGCPQVGRQPRPEKHNDLKWGKARQPWHITRENIAGRGMTETTNPAVKEWLGFRQLF